MTREQKNRRRRVILRGIVFAVLLAVLIIIAKVGVDPEKAKTVLACVGATALAAGLTKFFLGAIL